MLIIGDYLVIFLLHKWQATNKGPVAACSAVRLACWRTQSISCRPCTWTEIWNMGTWERNVSVFEKSCPKSSKSLCAPNHFDPWLGPWASPIFRDQLCVLCVKGVLVANWFSEANCVRMFVASADPTFHRQGWLRHQKIDENAAGNYGSGYIFVSWSGYILVHVFSVRNRQAFQHELIQKFRSKGCPVLSRLSDLQFLAIYSPATTT